VNERNPGVRRYALVLNDSDEGLRRFHLARVASPRAQHLERMENLAEKEREREAQQESAPGVN
jgi:hypothetical protein